MLDITQFDYSLSMPVASTHPPAGQQRGIIPSVDTPVPCTLVNRPPSARWRETPYGNNYGSSCLADARKQGWPADVDAPQVCYGIAALGEAGIARK